MELEDMPDYKSGGERPWSLENANSRGQGPTPKIGHFGLWRRSAYVMSGCYAPLIASSRALRSSSACSRLNEYPAT